MSNSTLPHAFVISLPEARERRDRLRYSLKEQGFVYSIFNAVDGRGFNVEDHSNYDKKRRQRYFGRNLLGEELGCFLSHKGVLEEIIKQNLPYAMVFEDDAIIHDALSQVAGALTSINIPDLVRFIGKEKVYKGRQKTLLTLCNEIKLVRLQGTPGGAYAYFVSLVGAKKLLQHMDMIYMPVDTVMGYSWLTEVDNLVTIPSPVTHDFIEESYIGDQRFDKTVRINGLKKIIFPLNRFFFKTKENIMKRIYFYWKSIIDF